tara:strand:- start:6467 stop:7414 length:948 start_codon:yes stop_codon:yes gene_type:complete
MNHLITGAAGFIGSHLTKDLIKKGEFVIGVDNLMLGKEENLNDVKDHENFYFLNEDILSDQFISAIDNLNIDIDKIWHLAASSDIISGSNNYILDHEATFLTTVKISQLAEEKKIKEIIFSSSGSVYGEKTSPVRETDFCEPISYYGLYKLASENFLKVNFDRKFSKVIILRFANIVGSNATHGVIYDFVDKLISNNKILNILGNGTQQKPYLHVSELIDGMNFVDENIKKDFQVFNIGPNDSGFTVKNIALEVSEEMLLKPELVFGKEKRGFSGDVPLIQFDTSKLEALGWKAKLTSEQAVKAAVKEIVKEKTN